MNTVSQAGLLINNVTHIIFSVGFKKKKLNQRLSDNHLSQVMEGYKDNFKIVSIIVGDVSSDHAKQYAKVLEPLLADPHTVFVISSDFCHWGSRFRLDPCLAVCCILLYVYYDTVKLSDYIVWGVGNCHSIATYKGLRY